MRNKERGQLAPDPSSASWDQTPESSKPRKLRRSDYTPQPVFGVGSDGPDDSHERMTYNNRRAGRQLSLPEHEQNSSGAVIDVQGRDVTQQRGING